MCQVTPDALKIEDQIKGSKLRRIAYNGEKKNKDNLILQSAIRLSLLELVEKTEQPIGKINFTKNVVNESMFYQYSEYGLPRPLFPNIHMQGIYSIDFDRTINRDPLITKTEKEYFIEPENRPIVMREVQEHLSPNNIHFIKHKMGTLQIKQGKKLLTRVFGSNDLALSQLNKYILNRAKQHWNWFVNPEYEKIVELNCKTISNTYSANAKIVSYSRGSTNQTVSSIRKTAIDNLIDLITNMILNKVENIKYKKHLWRYQINALQSVDPRTLFKNVFYIGRIKYSSGKFYCEDTSYVQEDRDAIEVLNFQGIEALTNYDALGIVGKITTVNDKPFLAIEGILILR